MRWISWYQELLTGIVLGYCSLEDLKYKSIRKKAAGWYALAAIAGRIVEAVIGFGIEIFIEEKFWAEADAFAEVLIETGIGILPGIICLLLGFLTRQSLGYGDGLLMIVCGISLGIEKTTGILLNAFILCGIWALIQVTVRKAKKKQEIPFVPFLFAGWMVCLVWKRK